MGALQDPPCDYAEPSAIAKLDPTWAEPVPKFENCIAGSYRYPSFPERIGGSTVTMKMPITFTPANFVTP